MKDRNMNVSKRAHVRELVLAGILLLLLILTAL